MRYMLLVVLVIRSCGVTSVNYAVDDLLIQRKEKVIVGQHPAIKMTIVNDSSEKAINISVTVKAKKKQKDVDVSVVKIESLGSGEEIDVAAILKRTRFHSEYDLLTYAISANFR